MIDKGLSPEELTAFKVAEDIAEGHTNKTKLLVEAIPVRSPKDGTFHVVYGIVRQDGYPVYMGAVEAFEYSQDNYDGFDRRQKETFPFGPKPGRKPVK